jgi:hemoglobin/transferrin/lactoferrin receptor protein
MKKINFMMLLLFIYSATSWTQTIKIVDQTTLQPLNGVLIKSNENNIVTNQKGEADISSFKGAVVIEFSHLNYTSKIYSYEELVRLEFNIRLTESSLTLNQVIVSANRYEENAKDVAQPVDVIRSSDLAHMSQPTTAEVLQNSGNVFVQKSQLGGGSPVLRGFETNRVLMVVDGVRMNNAIYRGGHLQNVITVDNNMLEKVEVVYGPGSVIYGSDALGGVMHFYSKSPLLSDDGSIRVKANAFTRYATASNEMSGHFDFSIGKSRFGSLTSFTYSNFGDLRQGYNRNQLYGAWGLRTFYAERINGKDSMIINPDWHLQIGSGYTQYDLSQKFLFKQNEKVSHILNLQYSTSSNISRYDRLTLLSGGLPRFAEWYYGPQERLFASYSLNLKNDHGFYENGRIIIAYQKIEESRHDRRFGKDILNHRTENLDIITFNADFAKKAGKHEFRYGLDGWYNIVNSSAYAEDIVADTTGKLDTRYPDGGSAMYSAALYASHSFEISEKLILTDGIRASNINLSSNFDDTTFFPFPFNSVTQKNFAVNGNLGLIYMPDNSWRMTLLGSTGFRAPNVDDLSKVFESTPGNVTVPNPDLKPEYSYNADFGISKTFHEKTTIGGTAFYTLLTNAINSQAGTYLGNDSIYYDGQMSAVRQSTNSAEAYIYGFNIYLRSDVTEYFSIVSTFNYTYGRIKTDSTDYPMDHIPPVFGKTSFNLKLNKFRGEFYALYNGAKKSVDYNLNGEDNQSYSMDPVNGYMPAWCTLNVRAAYQFSKNIQLQLALENLSDTYYRVFASNISAPGRNFIVTLRGNF